MINNNISMVEAYIKKNIFLFVSFFLISIVVYWNLWNTFFQQDEWLGFGQAIYQWQHLPMSLLLSNGIHFAPLSYMYQMLMFKLVGLNYPIYAWSALLIHTATGVLAFAFLRGVTKKTKISLLLSFLFLISYPARQVVVWYALLLSLAPCILFIMIFFVYLQKKINEQSISTKSLIILFSLFAISSFFQETGYTLLLLFPAYVYFFMSKKLLTTNRKKFFILWVVMCGILFLRFLYGLINKNDHPFEQGNLIVMTAYNMISLPPKMILQSIFELEHWWIWSAFYTHLAFPKLVGDGYIVTNTMFEDLVYYAWIPFGIFVGFCFAEMDKELRNIFFFSILWILAASWIIAPQTRRLSYLESRYLFFAGIGVTLFIYTLFIALFRAFKQHTKMLTIIVTLCSTVFILYSWIGNQYEMNSWYLVYSQERIAILKQITSIYPSVPKKVAFFVKCKEQTDCIGSGLVLPFQSGVGQMLLVVYGEHNEKAYAPFFGGLYLWDWEAEGYEEHENYGFGYFRDENKLKALVKSGKLLPQNIIAFDYSYSHNKIEDISKKVQKEVTEGN